MSEEVQLRYPIEAYTMAFDYVKHITTICTGSILLIAGLLEKLFAQPKWKACVATSLVSFFLAILSAVAAQAGIIETVDKEETIGEWAWPLSAFGVLGMYVFFLAGLVSLLLFALKNL